VAFSARRISLALNLLAAANHAPRDYKLKVVFPGVWFDDQNRMFSDGLGMQLL
jgi:hypothetical protein